MLGKPGNTIDFSTKGHDEIRDEAYEKAVRVCISRAHLAALEAVAAWARNNIGDRGTCTDDHGGDKTVSCWPWRELRDLLSKLDASAGKEAVANADKFATERDAAEARVKELEAALSEAREAYERGEALEAAHARSVSAQERALFLAERLTSHNFPSRVGGEAAWIEFRVAVLAAIKALADVRKVGG